jgi:hypothetical protein
VEPGWRKTQQLFQVATLRNYTLFSLVIHSQEREDGFTAEGNSAFADTLLKR